jgi:anti-sigma regulatory factor (Ser/Thr protein kinase)
LTSATFDFPATTTAPGLAREVLNEFVGAAMSPEAARGAEVMVSEVVSNSVLHAGLSPADTIGVDLDLDAARLRVAVSDDGPGFEVTTVAPQEMGGWGLVLVDSLSDRWGVVRNQPNRVWFELDR